MNSPPLGVVTGSTFRATHLHTGQVVALKVQPVDVSYPSNPHERQIYPLLQGGAGMPTLWASFKAGMLRESASACLSVMLP